MLRTQLYADPTGRFVHDIVLETCRRIPGNTALIDSSCCAAVFINGGKAFKYRMDEQEFLRKLAS